MALHPRLFQRDPKNASPSDNNEHALLILERLLFLREVGDFDSKGCLLLAEEVGSGDIWLHYIDVYTKESLLRLTVINAHCLCKRRAMWLRASPCTSPCK